MIRITLGLCCFVAAGSQGISTGWLVTLGVVGTFLILSGNKAIAQMERKK